MSGVPAAPTIALAVLPETSPMAMHPSDTASNAALRRLLDAAAVRTVVDGVDSAVDAKEWRRARALFADEVAVDFGAPGGGPGTIPADALIDGRRRNLVADKLSLHTRTNHAIAVDGDEAAVVSTGYAFNTMARPAGDALWEVWGVYRHTPRREADGWRITGFALEVVHARGNETVRTFAPDAAN